MSNMLDTDFPLPTACVNWVAGWVGAVPPYAAELAALRIDCCAAIYEHQSACQSHVGYDAAQTMRRLNRVLSYAEKLCTICTDRRSKPGVVTKLQQQHHRRSFPLEFEWCFPAEEDSAGCAKADCRTSTLPAFEYICLLSCICVAFTCAAEMSRTSGDYVSAIIMYSECIKNVTQRVQSSIGTALNAAQWNNMHRRGVPIQLLPTWLAVLSAKADHKAQLSAILLMAQDNADSGLLICLTRRAYHTICFLLRCVRRLLALEHYLSPTQQCICEELYRNVLTESHRLRIQCLLQEAEPALFQGCAPVARLMLKACRQSADIVWDEPSEAADMELRNHVMDTIVELETSASKSSSQLDDTETLQSITNTDDSFAMQEEAQLEQLIDGLQCVHWKDLNLLNS